MKYVEVNHSTRAVTWDKYFDYLGRVENQLPPLLRSYAADWGHYSLDGDNTLHDAWLMGVEFAHSEKDLALKFLGPRHDRTHVLRYVGLKAYLFDLKVEFCYGDRDVFVHEFRIENSAVTHEVLFANDGRIVITATTVVPEVGLRL